MMITCSCLCIIILCGWGIPFLVFQCALSCTCCCVLLFTAPDGVPSPLPVTESDRLSPRHVCLSWNHIPECQWNGEPLFYEVRVISLDQVTNRKKRQEGLVPNSAEACFDASNTSFEFTESVPASETSVVLKDRSLSKWAHFLPK